MDSLKLNFHPNTKEIYSFLPELEREYKKSGQGMFCNWDTITFRHKKDQVITLHLNNQPIYFLTWYRTNKIVEMEIIWSLPSFRGRGFGLKFQQMIIKEFKKRGDVALTLSCISNDGLKLAKRCDFQPKYICGNFEKYKNTIDLPAKYIKILRNTTPMLDGNEELKIRCYEKYNDESSFYGEFNLNADFEKQPVYWYVNTSWECKIVYKGKIIRQIKMKYFLSELRILLYDYQVAYLNHNIKMPDHWFKK